jgi:proteic killer suppression protein
VYHGCVIESFADPPTEHIYNGRNSKSARKIDSRVWPTVVRKLDILNAATSLNDLKSPGNQLKKLKGNMAGHWSVRVNDQYRIAFRFENGQAMDVRCCDLH